MYYDKSKDGSFAHGVDKYVRIQGQCSGTAKGADNDESTGNGGDGGNGGSGGGSGNFASGNAGHRRGKGARKGRFLSGDHMHDTSELENGQRESKGRLASK